MSGTEAGSVFDTDVLVVGMGPMGATTALALATYGIRVQLVNRYPWTANTPRAHITNQRTMEVFRDLGVESEIRKIATPWRSMGDTYFLTSLAGRELARLRSWGNGDDRASDYLQASPCDLVDIPQDKLEPVLVKHAAARGAALKLNTEYVSHQQDATGVTVQLRDLVDGRDYEVRCRYLVGADGARSKVLEDAGLTLEGHHARAATAYVLFKADLTRFVSHRPGVLYWTVSSDVAFGEIGMGLLRCIEPYTQWIAGWGVDTSKGAPNLEPDEVISRIRKMIGDETQEIDIQSTSVWYVNQAHAPQYSNKRVFCGGDAVHRHPPSNGLGSNTSVQDGFNLAWKLAFVVRELAGEQLLESYSEERAPVGEQVVTRANKSRLEYSALSRCFRDPDALDPVAEGLRQLAGATPQGVARRKALEAALRLKDHDYNAQGVELNQRYQSCAVLPDAVESQEVWKRDRELHYQASTRPGAKIPHAWLVNNDGRKVSTLDLVGKGKFTLVTGIAGRVWTDAAAKVGAPNLEALVIGQPGAQDCYCSWQEIREIDEDGALLVRPDGVICWRHRGGVEDMKDAKQLLCDALSRVLSM